MTKTFADGKYTIDVTKPAPDGKLVIGTSGPNVVTILKEGKADYAIEYSSVAIQNGLPYIELPVGMDLSSQEYADTYATVKVKRVSGNRHRDRDRNPDHLCSHRSSECTEP